MSAENRASRKNHKITFLVVAVLLLAVGAASVTGGAVVAILNKTTTDNEGYSLSNSYQIRSSTHAFMLALRPDTDPGDTALTKWVVSSIIPSKELFVGWAPINDTGAYLEGMQFEAPYPVWSWNYGPYSSTIDISTTKTWNAGLPSVLPQQENFWITSAQTSDVATIHYDRVWDNNTFGDRALLIMNADGSSNVQADLQLGTKIPEFSWMPLVLIPMGLALVITGTVLLLHRRRSISSKIVA